MIFCASSSMSTNRYSRLNTSSWPLNDFFDWSISFSRMPRSLGRLTVSRWRATSCSPSKSSGKTSRIVNDIRRTFAKKGGYTCPGGQASGGTWLGHRRTGERSGRLTSVTSTRASASRNGGTSLRCGNRYE